MRLDFARLLNEQMKKNKDIVLLCGDVGYGLFDEVFDTYSNRSFNIGSSEQLMIGMACGMALEKKIPICYSITPFLLYRPFEFVRNFLHNEKIPVKLVGSGRDDDYQEAGFTHHSFEAKSVLSHLSSIDTFFPENSLELESEFDDFLYSTSPAFLSLRR